MKQKTKTAKRKARQQAAWANYRRLVKLKHKEDPGVQRIDDVQFWKLSEKLKQNIVETCAP